MLETLQAFLSFFTTGSRKATSPTPRLNSSSKIVIVGSGCFGISTALHLLKRGYKHVTVLERATELPALDAASTDINKVVRSSYADEFYTRLAREAIEAWKDREVWGDNYHESGVLSCGLSDSLSANLAFQNDLKVGARITQLATQSDPNEGESVTPNGFFHAQISLGPTITRTHGYFNADGGWVYSKGAVLRAIEIVKNLGGRVLSGKEVSSIIKVGARTKGVKCKDGSEFHADLVILATGCWTGSTFPGLKLGKRAHATGHGIVTIQLTPEECDRYQNVPVILDLCSSGFYCFPPTDDNLIKMGAHFGGITNIVPIPDAPNVDPVKEKISTPRTQLSHGDAGLKVPKSEVRFMRECLRQVFPDLADKSLKSTRLCWYTDSPDSNWIIDLHPNDPGLALVTAGSGHGFKFLPVIGGLVADRLEGKMDECTRRRFAVDRGFDEHATYRDRAVLEVLNPDELIGPGEED